MTEPLDMTATYTVSAEAIESRLGDETVILHLGSGTYFGLDPVGTITWERLQEGDTPDAICAHIHEVFADVPDEVDADIATFLAKLLDHDLIERRP